MKVAKVKDHYTDEEFKKLFSTCKNDAILYNRLVFIRSIKNGNTIKETAKILDIDARTGSRWLKRYNEMGIDGSKTFGLGTYKYWDCGNKSFYITSNMILIIISLFMLC